MPHMGRGWSSMRQEGGVGRRYVGHGSEGDGYFGFHAVERGNYSSFGCVGSGVECALGVDISECGGLAAEGAAVDAVGDDFVVSVIAYDAERRARHYGGAELHEVECEVVECGVVGRERNGEHGVLDGAYGASAGDVEHLLVDDYCCGAAAVEVYHVPCSVLDEPCGELDAVDALAGGRHFGGGDVELGFVFRQAYHDAR